MNNNITAEDLCKAIERLEWSRYTHITINEAKAIAAKYREQEKNKDD